MRAAPLLLLALVLPPFALVLPLVAEGTVPQKRFENLMQVCAPVTVTDEVAAQSAIAQVNFRAR